MTRLTKSWLRSATFGGLALLGLSCGRPVAPGAPVPLTLKLRSPGRALPFTCYALHVVGPGITGGENPAEGNPCAPPGLGTAYRSTASGPLQLSLKVPAGRKRLIQVVGVQGPGCPAATNVADTLRAYDGGASLPADITGLFEVGRVETDLFAPSSLEITVAHDAADPRGLTFCQNGSPIPPLRLSPPSVGLEVSGSQVYGGTGGFPPYELKAPVGGALAGNTFAVPATETDTSLTVRDSRGNETTVTGRSFDGAGIDVWLRADTLGGVLADGGNVTDWDNSGNLAVLDDVTTAGTDVFFRLTGGPNSRPAVELTGLSALSAGPLDFNGPNPSSVRLLVVAARPTSTGGTLLCVTNLGSCSGATDYIHLRSPLVSTTTFTVRKNPTHLLHAGPIADETGYRLLDGRLDPGQLTYRRNGSDPASASFTSFGTLSFGGGSEAFYVGGDGIWDFFVGFIAEIILYFSDPGESRLNQTIEYLKLKYDLE